MSRRQRIAVVLADGGAAVGGCGHAGCRRAAGRALVLLVRGKITLTAAASGGRGQSERLLVAHATIDAGRQFVVSQDAQATLLFLDNGHVEQIAASGTFKVMPGGCQPRTGVQEVKVPEANRVVMERCRNELLRWFSDAKARSPGDGIGHSSDTGRDSAAARSVSGVRFHGAGRPADVCLECQVEGNEVHAKPVSPGEAGLVHGYGLHATGVPWRCSAQVRRDLLFARHHHVGRRQGADALRGRLPHRQRSATGHRGRPGKAAGQAGASVSVAGRRLVRTEWAGARGHRRRRTTAQAVARRRSLSRTCGSVPSGGPRSRRRPGTASGRRPGEAGRRDGVTDQNLSRVPSPFGRG